MRGPRSILAAVAAIVATQAIARDDYAYGPRPDWARYRALGEAALRAKLTDPQNWSIEWPNGYAQSGWRHKGTFRGYLTCGVLRATVPVAGRYARVNFVAVIDRDQVQTIDISQKMSNSLVNVWCDVLIGHGTLPPASLMTSAASEQAAVSGTRSGDDAVAIPRLGMTVRPMPEGAYVAAVDPGSPAHDAGIVLGMVIARAGGIDLAGLGPAMVRILATERPTVELVTAAGGTMTIRTASSAIPR